MKVLKVLWMLAFTILMSWMLIGCVMKVYVQPAPSPAVARALAVTNYPPLPWATDSVYPQRREQPGDYSQARKIPLSRLQVLIRPRPLPNAGILRFGDLEFIPEDP